jgi:hypothetical protein
MFLGSFSHALQVAQDRGDAAVGVLGRSQVELGEDAADVLVHRALGDEQAMPSSVWVGGMRTSTMAMSGGSSSTAARKASRQIVGMVRREAALVCAAAVGAGVALSAVPPALLGTGFLGRPWAAGPLWLLPAAATVAMIAWLATEIPVRSALRAAPADVLAQRS